VGYLLINTKERQQPFLPERLGAADGFLCAPTRLTAGDFLELCYPLLRINRENTLAMGDNLKIIGQFA
jgi:hypothetical protein